MPSSRVSRGRKSQELVAQWFREHGFERAQSRPASLPGVDITGLTWFAPEVKATAGQDFTGALRQARANAGSKYPLVIYRPKGYGPEKIDDWLVVFSLKDATELMDFYDNAS